MRWVRHNTLEYRLLFYKIFENRAASGDNVQSIQSLGHTTQSTTPIPLTLAKCDIFDMTLESKGKVTRRENRKKRKTELWCRIRNPSHFRSSTNYTTTSTMFDNCFAL